MGSQRKKAINKVLVMGLVLLGLYILSGQKSFEPVRASVNVPISYGWGISGNIRRGYESLVKQAKFVVNGPARIAQLESEMAAMAVKVAEVDECELVNSAWRELVQGRTETINLARVLMWGEEEMLLRMGAGGATEIGDVVVAEGLLGVVVRVSGDLVWAERAGEVLVDGVVAGTSIRGVVGRAGSDLLFRGVWQSEQVGVGDVVVTRGGQKIPAGMVVGRVVRVAEGGSSTEKQIWLDPVDDWGSLVFVGVVESL